MTEREKILAMVADGTITQEEADKLLAFFDEQEENLEEPTVEPQPNAPSNSYANTYGGDSGSDKATNKSDNESKTDEPDKGDNSNPQKHSTTQITGFDISWISGPIDIRSYDGSDINITEYSKTELAEEDKMHIFEENGILKIKWNKNEGKSVLNTITRFIGKPFLSKHLVVEIPQNIANQLTSLKCNGVSSKISVSSLSADDMRINSTSGMLKLEGISSKNIDASTVSGAINLTGVSSGRIKASSTSSSLKTEGVSVGDANFSTVSGSVHFFGAATILSASTVSGGIKADIANTPDSIKFDSISGGVKIWLHDSKGFTAKYSSMSGKFETEFPVSFTESSKKKNGQATFGDGSSMFDLSTMSGSIRIYRK